MSFLSTMGAALLTAFQRLCRLSFGRFDREEFKKFLRMGLIFALIIGIYWTLRPLKDSIFIRLVGNLSIPIAKTVSVLALLPTVMFYTKLLEKTSRERMFGILSMIYGVCILAFSGLMLLVEPILSTGAPLSTVALVGTQILGYTWYLFVESFGSLMVALFWAFAADTTGPDSAKRGFPLVVAIGQCGGILLPGLIGPLPSMLHMKTDSLSMALLACLTFLVMALVRYLQKATPPELLQAFHGRNEAKVESEQEPGFLEGLKLLVRHRYLIGIFCVIAIYEVIGTVFDFNFKMAASSVYHGVELSSYLSRYAVWTNLVSLLCLVFGVSNITRLLGVGVALAAMPGIFALALLGFLTTDSLNFLFFLMVGSKAINYALNGPALKQLYIPTTPDVRYKATAWIETFGSRLSKQAASTFNITLAPLQAAFGQIAGRARYLLYFGYLGSALLIVWFVTALFLGRKFRRAIETKTVVC